MTLASQMPHEGPFMFFNQGCNSLAVGTHENIKLYDVENLGTDISVTNCITDYKDAYVIERHFKSSTVFIVCRSNPTKLVLLNTQRNSVVQEKLFYQKILAVKLNQTKLVVCLNDAIFIYDYNEHLKLQQYTFDIDRISDEEHVTDTRTNSVCAITVVPGILQENLFGCAHYVTKGDVVLYDLDKGIVKYTIADAHKTPLAAIVFSPSGKEIATASQTGTLLRIFSIQTQTKLYEFRRGSFEANIYSIALNTNYLCCTSNRKTIHIFKLNKPLEAPSKEIGWYNYLTSPIPRLPSIVSTVTDTVSQVVSYITSEVAFARVSLTQGDLRRLVSFAMVDRVPRLLVASQKNTLTSYEIPREGGECIARNTYDLSQYQMREGEYSVVIPPLL